MRGLILIRMKYSTLFLTILLLSAALLASVPTDHAAYVSGSAAIPNGTEGSLNLEDGKDFSLEETSDFRRRND